MRYAIIYSKKDKAGTNIVNEFRKLAFSPQIPIIELKDETINTNIFKKDFPELKNIDFLVYASKHRSKDNKPALCLHAPEIGEMQITEENLELYVQHLHLF